MVKQGDESQSRPRRSPRVPRNMVQYTGTIVRDKWRWRTNMYKTERLGLLLTSAEKTAVVQMAEAEGGLSQSPLVRRLIRNAARERGIWPPDKPKHTIQHIREVQRG
jgi:hypothetical protein